VGGGGIRQSRLSRSPDVRACGRRRAQSIATPLIIGALVTETDVTPALVYVAVLSALGALSYLLHVGTVERIES